MNISDARFLLSSRLELWKEGTGEQAPKSAQAFGSLWRALFCGFVLGAGALSMAQAPLGAEAPGNALPELKLPVRDTVLGNGMRVILLERPQAPLVACRLFYATGSVHEVPGKAGLAHMLEHMLFKGTRKVGVKDWAKDSLLQHQVDSLSVFLHQAEQEGKKQEAAQWRGRIDALTEAQRPNWNVDELWTAYQQAGGTGLNAFTTDLATAYFVTLPREKTELYLWLEADRMQNGVLRDFLPERDVVREERRLRYDDAPYGRYFEVLSATFYEAHPYRIPTIGWPSDIEGLTAAAAKEHYRKYYKPNNAILVMVGDIKADSLLPKIAQYFGPIPRGESFVGHGVREPEPVGVKSLTMHKDAAKPRMDLLFPAPAVGSPEAYALEAVAGVLGGKSGRLYKRLVQKGLALDVDAYFQAQPEISTFGVSVNLDSKSDPLAIEAAVWEEINQVQDSLVSRHELIKVKNQAYMGLVANLGDPESAANQLGFAALYGNWRELLKYPERMAQVSPEQVQAVSRQYLQRERSTIGWMLPEALRPNYRKSAPKQSEIPQAQSVKAPIKTTPKSVSKGDRK